MENQNTIILEKDTEILGRDLTELLRQGKELKTNGYRLFIKGSFVVPSTMILNDNGFNTKLI